MLSKNYFFLVLFAGLLISPVVYILMDRWLATFAYAVGINAWFFVAGITGALVVAFLTVYIRSFNVLRNSPALALKYE
jgi:putative ABC transport system permease protein